MVTLNKSIKLPVLSGQVHYDKGIVDTERYCLKRELVCWYSQWKSDS